MYYKVKLFYFLAQNIRSRTHAFVGSKIFPAKKKCSLYCQSELEAQGHRYTQNLHLLLLNQNELISSNEPLIENLAKILKN